jgi:endoglucanase
VNYITQKGAYAMIQPHNYGRFNGQIITDTNGFQSWWKQLASVYKSNSKVIFDTNNEYHDMDASLVLSLNQAAINGIRAAGATSQWITPEGNCYTGKSSNYISTCYLRHIHANDPRCSLLDLLRQRQPQGLDRHAEPAHLPNASVPRHG